MHAWEPGPFAIRNFSLKASCVAVDFLPEVELAAALTSLFQHASVTSRKAAFTVLEKLFSLDRADSNRVLEIRFVESRTVRKNGSIFCS
eukprot:487636-Amphidinium_carterae.1